jgi:hypothetical protein
LAYLLAWALRGAFGKGCDRFAPLLLATNRNHENLSDLETDEITIIPQSPSSHNHMITYTINITELKPAPSPGDLPVTKAIEAIKAGFVNVALTNKGK